jgi:hypothetical protein
MMGVPSKLSVIRKVATLTRARPTLFLSCWAKAAQRKWNWSRSVCGSWTPESAKKRSVSRWSCKNKSLTNSLCNLPDVLVIAVINDTVLGGLLLESARYFLYIQVPTLLWAIRRSRTNGTGPVTFASKSLERSVFSPDGAGSAGETQRLLGTDQR